MCIITNCICTQTHTAFPSPHCLPLSPLSSFETQLQFAVQLQLPSLPSALKKAKRQSKMAARASSTTPSPLFRFVAHWPCCSYAACTTKCNIQQTDNNSSNSNRNVVVNDDDEADDDVDVVSMIIITSIRAAISLNATNKAKTRHKTKTQQQQQQQHEKEAASSTKRKQHAANYLQLASPRLASLSFCFFNIFKSLRRRRRRRGRIRSRRRSRRRGRRRSRKKGFKTTTTMTKTDKAHETRLVVCATHPHTAGRHMEPKSARLPPPYPYPYPCFSDSEEKIQKCISLMWLFNFSLFTAKSIF